MVRREVTLHDRLAPVMPHAAVLCQSSVAIAAQPGLSD